VHVDETFNTFADFGLGSYSTPPDAVAVIRGRNGRKWEERVGNRKDEEGEGRERREEVGREDKKKGGGEGGDRVEKGEGGSGCEFLVIRY